VTDDDHGPAPSASTPAATAAPAPAPASPAPGRSGPARPDGAAVAAFVVAVVVSTVAVLAGALLLALLSSDEGLGPVLAGTLGLALLVMPPLVVGTVLAAWDVSPAEDGRRRHARLLWSTLGAQAGGAALVVASAAVGGAPAWLPASFIALGAALTVVALVAGTALGERARRRAPDVVTGDARPLSRSEVRRGVRTVSLTFALTFVPIAVGLSFVPTDGDEGGADMLLVAAGVAFIAASVACLVVSFRLQRELTTLLGRDQERARRIGRAVTSRHAVDLGPDDERRAARWASVSAVSMPVQYAQTALLFAGLVCQQLPQALGADGGAFARVFVVVLVVVLVGFAPFFFTRAARARRIPAARTHLLESAERP